MTIPTGRTCIAETHPGLAATNTGADPRTLTDATNPNRQHSPQLSRALGAQASGAITSRQSVANTRDSTHKRTTMGSTEPTGNTPDHGSAIPEIVSTEHATSAAIRPLTNRAAPAESHKKQKASRDTAHELNTSNDADQKLKYANRVNSRTNAGATGVGPCSNAERRETPSIRCQNPTEKELTAGEPKTEAAKLQNPTVEPRTKSPDNHERTHGYRIQTTLAGNGRLIQAFDGQQRKTITSVGDERYPTVRRPYDHAVEGTQSRTTTPGIVMRTLFAPVSNGRLNTAPTPDPARHSETSTASHNPKPP